MTINFDAIAAFKGDGELHLSPDHTALFVIDMQRYFVEPDFPFGRTWAAVVLDDAARYFDRVTATVIPNIQALLAGCRRLALPVYFTAFGSLRGDERDLPGWARQHNTLSRRAVGAPMYPDCGDPSW
jgi:nicotinamidase-related amidase